MRTVAPECGRCLWSSLRVGADPLLHGLRRKPLFDPNGHRPRWRCIECLLGCGSLCQLSGGPDEFTMGLGAYGRGWRLIDPSDDSYGAPASGACSWIAYSACGLINSLRRSGDLQERTLSIGQSANLSLVPGPSLRLIATASCESLRMCTRL